MRPHRLSARAPRAFGNRALMLLVVSGTALVGLQLGLAASADAAVSTVKFAQAVTSPNAGVILTGSAINPATGKKYRYLWGAEDGNGFCREDADLNLPVTGSVTPAISSCTPTIAGQGIKANQIAYDSISNNVFFQDISANKGVLARAHFNPDGDGGKGAIDAGGQAILAAAKPSAKVGTNCSLPGTIPNSLAIGPDGNLYIGYARTGSITRYNRPNGPEGACTIEASVARTPDGKKNFGLGFIGQSLYGMDGTSAWVIPDIRVCPSCSATNVFNLPTAGGAALSTDQSYPGTGGQNVYTTEGFTVTRISFAGNPQGTVTSPYATGFSTAHGLVADATDPSNEVLYVGDDPTGGALVGQGNWWKLAPQTSTAPAAPINVAATAGKQQAAVTWTPGDTSPVTSYTVHTLLADGSASGVPAVTVEPSPTSATITGLTASTAYEFTVTATNAVGSNTSVPSSAVTPTGAVVPSVPLGVIVSAGDARAGLAWSPPADNGGATITGYTITAYDGNVASQTATVSGTTTSAAITGLTNGTPYTFTVLATNSAGNSVESPKTAAVTPTAPVADISLTKTGPATATVGDTVQYTLTATNVGAASASGVAIIDTLPASATLVGATATQGSCLDASCNLGTIPVNGQASVTVIAKLTATGQVTNSANVPTVPGEVNTANNTASVTTTVSAVAPPAPVQTTTDLQLTGKSSTGGPAKGSVVTYTWTVKNSGKAAANLSSLSLTSPGSSFTLSGTPTGATCTGTATLTCAIGTIAAGGQANVTVSYNVGTVAGTFPSNGSVTFSGTDSSPANNTSTVSVQVK